MHTRQGRCGSVFPNNRGYTSCPKSKGHETTDPICEFGLALSSGDVHIATCLWQDAEHPASTEVSGNGGL